MAYRASLRDLVDVGLHKALKPVGELINGRIEKEKKKIQLEKAREASDDVETEGVEAAESEKPDEIA